jgi:hypothetical protein
MEAQPQIRCPYTLRKLSEIAKTNDEHIFPEAIGGPQSYSVRADETVNSTFGHTTDARLVNSKLIEMWRAIYGIKGRLGREPRAELKGEVVGIDQAVKVKIRQGAPIVEYEPLVKIDWEAKTAHLVAPADQSEKELQKLLKRLAAKGIKLTTTNKTLRENPTFDLKGVLELPDVVPGALKIAYLVAFRELDDSFLDDPLNSEWQRVIKTTRMAELVIAYLVLGAGRSHRLSPFMISEAPWAGTFPDLSETEHRVVIYNAGESGIYAVIELLGGGFKFHCRLSRGGNFKLKESQAKIIVCDAKTSKVRHEDFTLPVGSYR